MDRKGPREHQWHLAVQQGGRVRRRVCVDVWVGVGVGGGDTDGYVAATLTSIYDACVACMSHASDSIH
eukprot:26205-Eustigmatos_ZCMA.PRE.1